MTWSLTNIPHNNWSGEEAILVIKFLESIIDDIEFRYRREIKQAIASRHGLFDPTDESEDDGKIPF